MMTAAFAGVLRRDLRLALRQWGDAAMIPAFYLIVVSLFPLGLGAAPETLARIAPGVLWVTALLAFCAIGAGIIWYATMQGAVPGATVPNVLLLVGLIMLLGVLVFTRGRRR